MSKEEAKSDLQRVFRTAKVVGVGLGILLVLLYFASGFYSVKPEQRGVVKRLGRVVDDNVLPGIHYHLPWPVETVLRPATTEVRSMNVSFGMVPAGANIPDNQRDKIEAESLMTGDENLVLVSLFIQYMIDDAGSYLFNTKSGVEWLLSRIVRAACVKSAAEMTVDEMLVTGKFLFQNSIKEAVQAGTHQYDLGIRIASIQIQSVQPPSKVAGSDSASMVLRICSAMKLLEILLTERMRTPTGAERWAVSSSALRGTVPVLIVLRPTLIPWRSSISSHSSPA